MESKKNDAWKKPSSSKKSAVWQHYLINKNKVKCIHCEKELTFHGSTTGMSEHLSKIHKIEVKKLDPSKSGLESCGSIKNWLNDVNENSGEITMIDCLCFLRAHFLKQVK